MRGRSAKTINCDVDPRVITKKIRNVEEMSKSTMHKFVNSISVFYSPGLMFCREDRGKT